VGRWFLARLRWQYSPFMRRTMEKQVPGTWRAIKFESGFSYTPATVRRLNGVGKGRGVVEKVDRNGVDPVVRAKGKE
jgi:hypothetical protein